MILPNFMPNTKPHCLILWVVLILSTTANGQHHIKNGSMGVTIKVNKDGIDIPIDSLCDGFDPETNNPINLVLPPKSSMSFATDPSVNILNYKVNAQEPRYINEPAKSNGFSSSSSPGSENTYTFVDQTTSDTLILSWKVDYAKVELIQLFPAHQFPNYVNFQFQNLFEDSPDTAQFNWLEKDFIREVDARGIPVNPEFPYRQNDLFFVVEHLTDNATIQLKGLHDEVQVYNEQEPFELFIYEDLPDGQYEYVVRPYKDAPDSKSLIYSFTILRPWWFQEWAIAGFIVVSNFMVFGMIFLSYRRRQRRREKELHWQQLLSEAELKAIRAQLNPHFLFNALGSIQNLVIQQKNEVANTYLTKLSRLLRNVLSASEQTFHELGNELGLVELYLELEQLRFPFEVDWQIGEEVPKDTLIPVMILQPFVENAIKHGVAGRKEGKVTVRARILNESLVIDVLDNGPGLSQPNENSTGLQLSKASVGPLSELYGNEATISIDNRKDASGVHVQITLPVG